MGILTLHYNHEITIHIYIEYAIREYIISPHTTQGLKAFHINKNSKGMSYWFPMLKVPKDIILKYWKKASKHLIHKEYIHLYFSLKSLKVQCYESASLKKWRRPRQRLWYIREILVLQSNTCKNTQRLMKLQNILT